MSAGTDVASQERPTLCARLPQELLVMILRYVYEPNPEEYLTYLGNGEAEWDPLHSQREQLKPLRLQGRGFHDAVTPIVFASIHIHASELSFCRAENIAGSSLAGYVREIVYHEGSFATADRGNQNYFRTLASHRRRQDYPRGHHFASSGVLYDNYLQEIRSANTFRGFEIERTTSLLRKLPRCITFLALPHSSRWGDSRTSAYTLRRTGLSYFPMRNNPASERLPFINSTIYWKPRVLNLSIFSHTALCDLIDSALPSNRPTEPLQSTDNWADQLISLKLALPTLGLESQYTSRFQTLFRNCHNLAHLELTGCFEPLPVPPLFPENCLSRLVRLTISKGSGAAHWVEESIYAHVKSLAGTLKHLHFDCIQLERCSNFEEPLSRITLDGSILRLLFNITPFTNLESCTGLDTVVDIKADFRMKGKITAPGFAPGKKVILAKVEDAVCGRLAWPERFNSDYFRMDKTVSAIHEIDATEESAFIFSAWEDTVDPWHHDDCGHDDISNPQREVREDDGINVDSGPCRRKNARLVQEQENLQRYVPAARNGESSSSSSNNNIAPRRSRMSRILGLKKGRTEDR